MSSGHKTMTFFVTVICGLILVIAGLTTRWPPWAWAVAAAALLVGAGLVLVAGPRPRGPVPPEYALEPDWPIPQAERWEQAVSGIALPSRVDDYDFLFSATVRWCPLDAPAAAPHVNAGALAIESVLERARHITVLQPPHRSSLAQYQLNGALGTMRPDPSCRVEAMAENVALRLCESDAERLVKLSAVRKDEDVWEHERNWERNKREYLGKDVLKDTGSAVVWWMARNEDEVERTVNLIGPLAQLTSAANNEDVPEPFQRLVPGSRPEPEPEPEPRFAGAWPPPYERSPYEPPPPADDGPPGGGTVLSDLVDRLMDQAGMGEDAPERALFARRIANDLDAANAPDAADEIRRRFDAPTPPPAADPPDDDDGPDSDEPRTGGGPDSGAPGTGGGPGTGSTPRTGNGPSAGGAPRTSSGPGAGSAPDPDSDPGPEAPSTDTDDFTDPDGPPPAPG
ncbi:hypothetical protein AB0I49_08425 [Streptomyces sp. NPDC050617]|uniref:hypothetical protein n=1 Tax=Streptomyces sp. NPDC050617 TaxID=3154628 RepID=UPI003449CC8C